RGFSSMSAALESFYSAKDSAELFAARQRELLKLAGQHCTRLEKKISLQEDDLRQAQAGERYKEAGDLLCANLFSLKNGMESVVLENFYNQGEPLEIKLNPLFSPEQNLRHYYKLYNKCKNSIKSISCQLAANKEELDYLRAVVFSLENSLCQEDLQAVKEELRETGYLKEQKGGKKEKAAAALPPLSFTSSDGFNILCGRNNRQNDLLTLKTAAKNDLWLHAKDIPGSHVVIRCAGAPVPESTLLEAAQIAAWHSKARQSPKVPVDYTTVAQVKKPSGAKPGMVIYFQQKTLMVEPKESVGKIE
ncbi:MAG: NFACT family protein, partial [Clostridiales bacterium]|nr:NFACT family protein [Clostridiales bacterium]